ncbi:MAG TPA: DUF6600 domain-containing protein [Stellaceae bacterium]|jgi:hypothetical protein
MRRALFALPAAFLVLTPALAPGASAADPPGRVGRLSYIDGTVSFHPSGDQGDWAPATVNYPVTTGESFWTDENAKAEIEVGPAELRLDQASQLDISALNDRAIDVQLDQGVLNLHFWQMPRGEVKVTTPRGQVAITRPGSYDIDAGQPNGDQPADQIQVSVLAGAARFDTDHGAVDIGAGQAAVIAGNPPDIQLAAAQPSDFDQWAQSREERETAAQQPRYVPAAVTGYQDLDQYGSWSQDPQYGEVWYPSGVPEGWAPYRYGHWAWVAPWGWTWIDDTPWGFAPFHYGRWIDRDDRWAWVPADIPAQPVYAPALVAFIGGDGWGVDLAAGAAVAAIGWVALAPHEEYHPYFHASENWARGANGRDWNARTYNVTHGAVSNYHNRDAATVVPAAAFAGAAPVQRATVSVAPDQLAHTRTTTALANFRPSANARVGHADPAAATAVATQPNAKASVAPGRVAATTPPAIAAEKAPTAPGPHRVTAAATRPQGDANAGDANAPAAAAANRNQAASQHAQDRTAPNQPQRTQNQPSANQPQPGQTQSPAGQAHARNQALANQPPREARTAPNAPAANANLAPHPAPPHQAVTNARPETPRPGQAARPEQALRQAAPQHPATPQTAARPVASPAHRAAPAPQVAHLPPPAPHPAASPPAAHPMPAPQVAHAPPPAPHPAAPPPAPRPVPAPQIAHAPPSAPRPAPAQVAHAPAPAAHPAPPASDKKPPQ